MQALLILCLMLSAVLVQSDISPALPALEIITPTNAAKITQITPILDNVRHISVSLNSQLMAIATQYVDNDYHITLYDLETGEAVSFMHGRMDSFHDLIWSPDSQRIAVISGRTTGGGVEERSVKVYTVSLGSERYYYGVGNSDAWFVDYVNDPYDPRNPVQVAWNPTSDMLAIAFYEKLAVYELEGNSELFSTSVPGISTVTWLQDGKSIITKIDHRTLYVWGVPLQSDS
jgi:WD40 repeat protein